MKYNLSFIKITAKKENRGKFDNNIENISKLIINLYNKIYKNIQLNSIILLISILIQCVYLNILFVHKIMIKL